MINTNKIIPELTVGDIVQYEHKKYIVKNADLTEQPNVSQRINDVPVMVGGYDEVNIQLVCYKPMDIAK